MTADDPKPPQTPPGRGPTTGILILLFGAVEVGIVYGLIALDTPVAAWARRMAETWPGRILLASIGLGVICAGMIALLTIAERRQANRGQHPAH